MKLSANYKDRIAEIEKIPDGRILFTEQEDEIIKKYYPTKGSRIGKVLGKSMNGINNRARKLGVRYNSAPPDIQKS